MIWRQQRNVQSTQVILYGFTKPEEIYELTKKTTILMYFGNFIVTCQHDTTIFDDNEACEFIL